MTRLTFEQIVPHGEVGLITPNYESLSWHDTLVWDVKAAKQQHQSAIQNVITTGSGHAAAVLASGGGFTSDNELIISNAILAIQEPLAAGQHVTLTVSGDGHALFQVDLDNTAKLVNFTRLFDVKDVTFTLSDPSDHLVMDDLRYRVDASRLPVPIGDPPHFRGMTELNLHDPNAFYDYLATHPGATPADMPEGWVG